MHELVHLGQPFLGWRGAWFMEGLATYLEPLIRVQTGLRTPEQVWLEWFRGMPSGAYVFNLEGLPNGNAYWGGALFFLVAHVETLKRTEGRRDLSDCVRAITRQAGGTAARATVGDMLTICDTAVGEPLFSELAERYASAGVFSLPDLWRSLGVSASDGVVRYDSAAPYTDHRTAIFRKPSLR